MRRLGTSRETVRSATRMPIFRSSPWILGATQKGLAAAIRVTRAVISGLIGGRPRVGRPESLVQCSRKRRRCHRRTVSGVTITRGCLHPAQTLVSATQKSRSVVRSFGRVTVCLYTASCWRKARFSRARWRWPPRRNGRSRSRWSRRGIIEPGSSPEQSHCINHLSAGRSFGEGQDPSFGRRGDATLPARSVDRQLHARLDRQPQATRPRRGLERAALRRREAHLQTDVAVIEVPKWSGPVL